MKVRTFIERGGRKLCIAVEFHPCKTCAALKGIFLYFPETLRTDDPFQIVAVFECFLAYLSDRCAEIGSLQLMTFSKGSLIDIRQYRGHMYLSQS